MLKEEEKQSVLHIQSAYEERGGSKLDELRKTDKKVKLPAELFAYIFGIAGALVLGTGMCLAMKILGNLMALGIVIGCVGIAMVCVNYPIYCAILKSRKKKYGEKILSLSKELLNED